jgi:MoxR-like ATPase
VGESLDTLTAPGSVAEDDQLIVSRPTLILALRCDAPRAPSSCHALVAVDEVLVGRGAEDRAWRIIEEGRSRLYLELADARMSRAHARLERPAGRWRIVDLGAKNGVHVNGERVAQATLADGDVVELGGALFLYRHAFPWVAGESPDRDTRTVVAPTPGLRTLLPDLAQQFEALAHVARGATTILIRGETGTGKELVARSVHELSTRTGELITANCAAVPENLVEATFFGHRRGAFSGATEEGLGLVRAADGGTLFLDEIGDLRPASQGALLRVLQEREVMPVGAHKAQQVDVRFVAATHRDVADETQFRADLLARLAGFTFDLPPLRERREDLGLLVGAILAARAEVPAFSTEAGRQLLYYDWPRNVRELEHAVLAACDLASARSDEVRPRDLPVAVREARKHAAGLDAGDDAPDDGRREELLAALAQHGGNVTQTAESMGISRMQVHRLARRHGIDPASFRR